MSNAKRGMGTSDRKSGKKRFWAGRTNAKVLGLRMYLACSTVRKKAGVTGRGCIRGRIVGNSQKDIKPPDYIDYSRDSSFYFE